MAKIVINLFIIVFIIASSYAFSVRKSRDETETYAPTGPPEPGSTTEIASETPPECEPEESFQCPEYVEPGLHPTADNCSQYWQCSEDPSIPAVRKTCPQENATALLYFNPESKVCDWQWNVECRCGSQQPTGPPQTRPTEESTTEEEQESTEGETRPPAESTSQSSCPPFRCPDKYEAPGLYPTADNCSQFWQCFDYPRDPVRQTCARQNSTALLYFNDDIKVCDFQWNVTCNANACQPSTTSGPTDTTTTTEETTTEAETTTEPSGCPDDDDDEDDNLNLRELCRGCDLPRLVPNPNSQQRYVYCGGSEGSNEVRKCSPGLLFDADGITCTYAGLVNPNGPQVVKRKLKYYY